MNSFIYIYIYIYILYFTFFTKFDFLLLFPQIQKSSLLKSRVVMQIFDFNRFSKHHIIGELRVVLGSVDWNHVIEEWQDLAEPAKFEVSFVSILLVMINTTITMRTAGPIYIYI